jgi:hypothetical protein
LEKQQNINNMGQYLAIGIVRSFSVKKNELASARITREEVETMIAYEQAYDFSLFDMAESDEYFTYRLKDGILVYNCKMA